MKDNITLVSFMIHPFLDEYEITTFFHRKHRGVRMYSVSKSSFHRLAKTLNGVNLTRAYFGSTEILDLRYKIKA